MTGTTGADTMTQRNSVRILTAVLFLAVVHPPPKAAGAEQSNASEEAAAQRQLGLDFFRDGQFGTAIEAYRRALELNPGAENLYLEAADVHIAARLPAEAESLLAEASVRFPDSASPAYNLVYHDLAELWVDHGRLPKASDAMEAASRRDGPVPAALIFKRLGDFNTDLLRLDRALAAYRTALRLEPGNLAIQVALGNLQLRRNSLDEAEAIFSGVAGIVPNNVDALHGIAEIHRRRGRFDDALGAADRVLEQAPDHRGALYIRGTSLVRLGRRDEGDRDLQRYRQLLAEAQAEEHRRRDINTFQTGGMHLVLEGRYDEAIRLLETGIESYPGVGLLYLRLGQTQGEAGRHDAAIETFQGMLELGVGEPAAAHLNLAREYLAVGNTEASLRHQALHEAESGTAPGR